MYLCAPLEKLINRKDTEARKRKGKGKREKVYPKANGLEAFSVGHRPTGKKETRLSVGHRPTGKKETRLSIGHRPTGKKVGHHPPKKHLRLSAGNNLESEIRNPTFEIYNCD